MLDTTGPQFLDAMPQEMAEWWKPISHPDDEIDLPEELKPEDEWQRFTMLAAEDGRLDVLQWFQSQFQCIFDWKVSFCHIHMALCSNAADFLLLNRGQ